MELLFFAVIVFLIVRHFRKKASDRKEIIRLRLSMIEKREAVQLEAGGRSSYDHSTTSKASMLRESSAAWIPPGESKKVKGKEITVGMIYVGKRLGSPRSYYGNDSALIDPSLEISWNGNSEDMNLGYWPSYAEMTPSQRGTYLNWLSAGRPSQVDIGYVFVVFYGLERRLLLDNEGGLVSAEELDSLISELKALLSVYGSDSSSFQSYCSQLIDYVRYSSHEAPEVEDDSLEEYRRRWELPIPLRYKIALVLRDQGPIPANLAYEWFMSSPDIVLRTPATRCFSEFRALFMKRYESKYGDRFPVKEARRRLTINYHSASPSLPGYSTELEGLCDVSHLKKPVNALQKVADSSMQDLDAYSRYVGRSGDTDSSLAIAYLPKILVPDRAPHNCVEFVDNVREEIAASGVSIRESGEVLSLFPVQKSSKITRLENDAILNFFDAFDIGLVPDSRIGARQISSYNKIAFFDIRGQDQTFSEKYKAISILLDMGARVALADDVLSPEERSALEELYTRKFKLSAGAEARLSARLDWIAAERPDIREMKRNLDSISDNDRQRIGSFLLAVAGADGFVSADELKTIEKLYRLLGLATDDLYQEVHNLSADPQRFSKAALKRILIRDESEREFAIPKRDSPETVFSLDIQLIDKITSETADVFRILDAVFDDTDVNGAETEHVNDASDDVSENLRIHPDLVLDPKHTELCLFLLNKTNISRETFQVKCQELGLMPSGALEIINESSVQAFGDILVEDDDTIEINNDIAQAIEV